MRRVTFTADDLGLSSAVNQAILEAYTDGALTSAALMLGQPGSAEAIELARRLPGLEIGWHAHLCDSHPARGGRWARTPWQAAWQITLFPGHWARVRADLAEQWRQFQSSGLVCRFLNTHHHLHCHPWVARWLGELVGATLSGWQRGQDYRFWDPPEGVATVWSRAALRRRWIPGPGGGLNWPAADSVWGVDRLWRMQADEVDRTARQLPPGRHEFIFHPRGGAADEDLKALLALRRLGWTREKTGGDWCSGTSA